MNIAKRRGWIRRTSGRARRFPISPARGNRDGSATQAAAGQGASDGRGRIGDGIGAVLVHQLGGELAGGFDRRLADDLRDLVHLSALGGEARLQLVELRLQRPVLS